jgi:RNA polymerase sigma-70 factor (ECF subfamily)
MEDLNSQKTVPSSRTEFSEDPDFDLIRRAQEGEFKAFETLVVRYQDNIYALALRITGSPQDAEEVAQTTFLSVMEHLKGFRGDARFSTWIFRIAANHALKLIRKRNVRKQESIDDDLEEGFERVSLPEFVAPWSHSPEMLASQEETRHILNDALRQLDEKHRAVFLLRDFEGLSTEETADALGLSAANVKVRLMRARLMLREILTQAFADPRAALASDHHSH